MKTKITSVLIILMIALSGCDDTSLEFKNEDIRVAASFEISGYASTANITLEEIENIKDLTIIIDQDLNLDDLSLFKNLETLSISSRNSFSGNEVKMTPIESDNLKELNLSGFRGYEDLDFIKELTGLTHLSLFMMRGLIDINAIESLVNLEKVSFDSTPIPDIIFISSLSKLTKLKITKIYNASVDFSPILESKSLEILDIADCTFVPYPEILEELKKKDNLEIYY